MLSLVLKEINKRVKLVLLVHMIYLFELKVAVGILDGLRTATAVTHRSLAGRPGSSVGNLVTFCHVGT